MKLNNLFIRNNTKLKNDEIEASISKIRDEYDKYIVTYHKDITLKNGFESRCSTAHFESMDMVKFLQEEILAIQSLFKKEKELHKKEREELLKKAKKTQPDFADKVLKKLMDRILIYPSLDFHTDASAEIKHLYGAVQEFETKHWAQINNFIKLYENWELKKEKKDLDNQIWRFVPSGESGIPIELQRYNMLLCAKDSSLGDISREAQRCIKKAAFLLNEVLWTCNVIIKSGIDSAKIEKNLIFVQNIVKDFRIKDLKNR